MSITFWTDGDEEIVTTYDCYHCENRASYDRRVAAGLLDEDPLGFWADDGIEYDPATMAYENCSECKGAGVVEFSTDKRSINLANGNAGAWLALMNIDYDYCGTIDAPEIQDWDTIRDRMVSSAQAKYLGHENFLYFRDLFRRWNELVKYAATHENQIHWG